MDFSFGFKIYLALILKLGPFLSKSAVDRTAISFIVIIIVHYCGNNTHDDVIKWKHFPRYWPFVRGIHRSPVNSPHKSQWRGALMFSFISARINGWVNNRDAGDLRRIRPHYDVTVMHRRRPGPGLEKFPNHHGTIPPYPFITME